MPGDVCMWISYTLLSTKACLNFSIIKPKKFKDSSCKTNGASVNQKTTEENATNLKQQQIREKTFKRILFSSPDQI